MPENWAKIVQNCAGLSLLPCNLFRISILSGKVIWAGIYRRFWVINTLKILRHIWPKYQSPYRGEKSIALSLFEMQSTDDASKQSGILGRKFWRKNQNHLPAIQMITELLVDQKYTQLYIHQYLIVFLELFVELQVLLVKTSALST